MAKKWGQSPISENSPVYRSQCGEDIDSMPRVKSRAKKSTEDTSIVSHSKRTPSCRKHPSLETSNSSAAPNHSSIPDILDLDAHSLSDSKLIEMQDEAFHALADIEAEFESLEENLQLNFSEPIDEHEDNDPLHLPHAKEESISLEDAAQALRDTAPEADHEEGHEALVDVMNLYLKDIRKAPLLTAEQEIELSRQLRSGCEKSRHIMIKSNLRLVVKIAKRYLYSGLTLLDLIEEGNLGLMHAVEKYDPELGFRFSTYGAWWIQQSIERAIMNQARTVRVPIHVLKQLKSCMRTMKHLEAELNQEPRLEEIAKALEHDTDSIQRLLLLQDRCISIDAPISELSESTIVDLLECPNGDPSTHQIQSNMKAKMLSWTQRLSERQREVIMRRYGLGGFDQSTLDKTSLDMGITRERVRQIQSEAIERLRRMIKRDGDNAESLIGN